MPELIDLEAFLSGCTATPQEGYAPLGVQFRDERTYDGIIIDLDTDSWPNQIEININEDRIAIGE